MSSATVVGTHNSGAGPLSLMSCVRESSPLQEYERDYDKNVASKRKFWNPKKWFKRKHKQNEDVVVQDISEIGKDSLRSRSTSELSVDEDQPRRSSTSMHPGLSVSHDSVFHPLNSGSDLDLEATQSSSSLSISQPLVDPKLQTELSERLRLRRSRGTGGDCTSEDDEGLPRSPCCNSPTTADGFLLLDKTAIKDLPTKSHSTCSDGSLLSMDSSEMDEDSFGLNSRHSSKLSLPEKRTDQDSDLELAVTLSTTPLNHSAAHHRVSVRPKRTYGAPRRKKGQQLSSALPATPEVNEESSTRSISPESVKQEPLTELYSVRTSNATFMSESKLKCSSLPPGTAPPTSDEIALLNRSKSNAGNKSRDITTLHEEEKEEKLSLFERLFPRRSGKKNKKKDDAKVAEEVISKKEEKVSHSSNSTTTTKLFTETTTYSSTRKEEIKPLVAPRTGAASRQRIQPIDIPSTPVESRLPKYSPDKYSPPSILLPKSASPIQVELESMFKQRQISLSSSPVEKIMLDSPPRSPKSLNLPVISKLEHNQLFSKSTTHHEDIRSKVKIAGLSSLQQRVLSLNDDENDGFKSLTDFSLKPSKPVTKSHSFKSSKQSFEETTKCLANSEEEQEEKRKSVIKASSLDSVKNLEDTSSNHIEQRTETQTYSSYLKHERVESRLLKERADRKLPVNTLETSETEVKLSPVSYMEEKETKVVSSETRGNRFSSSIFKEDKTSMKLSPIIPKDDKTILNNNLREETVELKLSLTSPTTEKTTETHKFPKGFGDAITISGPSHTAVVNVSSSENFTTSTNSTSSTESSETKSSVKENQVSVTKIQLKHETTQLTRSTVSVPKSEIPEFLNKQLNKVDVRPTSNIIFSMKPKITAEEHQRPTTLFNSDKLNSELTKPPMPRKFSKENVEIIEKENKSDISPKTATDNIVKKSPTSEGDIESPKTPPIGSVTSQNRFKKNDTKPSSRKSSVISITPESPTREKPMLKYRSMSLDSLKSDQNESADISSEDSLDQSERKSSDEVVLRRKSVTKKKNDEEPELMKVFARRSLKLKDSQVEEIQEALVDMKTRDSDKENNSDSVEDDCVKEEIIEVKPTIELPSPETQKLEILKSISKEEPEVQLRRPLNSNNFFISSQRSISMNATNNRVTNNETSIKKQSSLSERRRTDQWITNLKKDEVLKERVSEEIINLSPKSEEIKTETKNFSQRKAEWEKRAQLAQKKTVP